MNDKLRVKIKIADVEIPLDIDRNDEEVYRKAAYHINQLWGDWRTALKNRSPQEILARIALAFAELSYRKSDELEHQARMIEHFEKQLDELLLKAE